MEKMSNKKVYNISIFTVIIMSILYILERYWLMVFVGISSILSVLGVIFELCLLHHLMNDYGDEDE